jgi:hypothetical protein
MVAMADLTEEEAYLVSILMDPSGIELAEFCKFDPTSKDGCYRVWDFQYPLYRSKETYQIDWCSRAIGKTQGIIMRLTGFVFSYAGQEALVLAPSANHLDPIKDKLVHEVRSTRLLREMLLKGRTDGIKGGQGQFQMFLSNGSRILGRIPGLKGKNTKGIHSIVIETDESQEFEDETWIEILESLERTQPDAVWRAHGVSRGSRDKFYKFTMGEDPDLPWFVHRYPAMYRPTWSDDERREKIALYGGSKDNVDYKRNIFGDHGDVSNRLFVISRLNNCTRIQETPWAIEYNDTVYYSPKINDEYLRSSGQPIEALINPPTNHLNEEYIAYYGGADFGFTNDPSELLIFGEVAVDKKTSILRLLSRIHMQRISAADQAAAIRHIFDFYGARLKRVTIDKTGAGLPIWQELDPEAVGTGMAQRRTPEHIAQRVKGYGFSEKIVVELDDRELDKKEKPEDAVIKKTIIEYGIDEIRKLVDAYPDGHIELPYDKELLAEWQGSEVQYTRDETGTGVRRALKKAGSGSGLHTLDAALLTIAGKNLIKIETAIAPKPQAAVSYVWG